MLKKEIRKWMRDKLKTISNEQYIEFSRDIQHLLYQTKEWNEAQSIGITISKLPEVDTYEIIKKAWGENKLVAVPKCLPETKELCFYLIDSFEQVEKGYFDLVEPIPKRATLADKEQIDLIFVPGLAFSIDGSRLGQGGGYYDRFLPNYHGKSIALAFEKQIINHVPIEVHDQKVSKIITEKGVYEVND